MRAERTIDARPSGDELSSILRDVARAFDLQPKGPGRLAGGTLFTADPNDTRLLLTVTSGEDGLRLVADAYAFPGTGAKVRRLTEARLGAIADMIGARLRGTAPAARAPFRSADADLPGAAIGAAKIGAATAAAMLAAFVTTTAMACVIIDDTIDDLGRRSPFIEYLKKNPLPTVDRLRRDGPSTILGAAALFALPCAFLVGWIASASLAWSELGGGAGRRMLAFVRDVVGAAMIGWGLAMYAGGEPWTAGAIGGLGVAAALSLLHVVRDAKVEPLLKAVRGAAAAALVGWILYGLGRSLGGGREVESLNYAIVTAATLMIAGAPRSAGTYAFVLLVLLVGASLAPMTGPLVAAAFAMAVPLSAFGGYLWVWGRRREKRDDRTADDRARDERRAALSLAALLLLGAAVASAVMPGPRSDEQVVVGMGRFRDRFMMTNPVGKTAATSYYRYTLYAAEPLKASYEFREDGRSPYHRNQRTMLLTYAKAETLPVLYGEGFYVTEAWEQRMDPRDAARLFDHPYDMIVLRAEVDRANPGAPMKIDFLEEVTSRGLWDRTVVFAPSRAYERSPEGVRAELDKIVPLIPVQYTAIHEAHTALQSAQGEEAIRQIAELKALIDRTPWDLPEGVPPESVLRVPYAADEDLFRFLSERSQANFPGRFMRTWVAWGWQSLFYLGGPMVAFAVLLPAALPFALLFRRASRRRAVRITAAVFVLSTAGLLWWASANAEATGALAEVRRLDRATGADRLAGAMAHADADVRYEAVFTAHEWFERTRGDLEAAVGAYRRLETTPLRAGDKQEARKAELERLQRDWWARRDEHERLAGALGAALRSRLEDADVRVRVWAAGALGRRGLVDGPEEIDALSARLADPEFFVVYRAAGALGDIGGFEGNGPGGPFRPISDKAVYRAMLEAGNVVELFIEGETATARLREPFEVSGAKYPYLQMQGWSIGELTGGPASPKVRLSVRAKLTGEVVPALQRLMREEDWYVGGYALHALRQIDPGAGF